MFNLNTSRTHIQNAGPNPATLQPQPWYYLLEHYGTEIVSVSDPDSIRSVDPYPDKDPDSGSGSRRANDPQKEVHVLKCRMFSFEG